MKKHFMKKYAMSEIGAKNLLKAIFSRTILNLSKLFPSAIAFMFIFQYLGGAEGIKTQVNLTLLNYVIIILVMLIAMFLTASWDYVRLYNNVYMESANIRIDVANRLKKLPLSFFDKRDLTDISSTMMEDLTLYEQIFSHAVPQLYATIISTTIVAVSMFVYNWQLALATFWVIPVSLLLSFITKRLQRKVSDKFIKSSREVFDELQEDIEQIADIKAYNLEKKTIDKFYQKLDNSTKNKKRLEFVMGILTGFSNVILRLGIISVAIIGGRLFALGQINILVYVTFLMLSTSVYLPIDGVITFISLINTLDSVVSRIKEIKTMPVQEGKVEMHPNNYDIEFKDVYFGYEDYEVINGVNFTAKQGEVTALIGESGSGKSTLAKLALRFWDVNKGQIFLGGEDISKVYPETLLKNFSIVFQDVVLFNASIKDNIKIGKKSATDEEIIKAAKIARCYEFINKMPNGINTLIGENGQKLSGGERQRISIARAILKDSPIILLDETTASLDVENESLIQEALSELIKNKTVICIAHRLRTIRSADKIVLLKQGKIEAMGTDKELQQKSKYYNSMLEKANAQ